MNLLRFRLLALNNALLWIPLATPLSFKFGTAGNNTLYKGRHFRLKNSFLAVANSGSRDVGFNDGVDGAECAASLFVDNTWLGPKSACDDDNDEAPDRDRLDEEERRDMEDDADSKTFVADAA